eukprot:293985-Hanusia_phi.AAC.2
MLELLKPIARMMESVKYRWPQPVVVLKIDIAPRFYASSILFIYEGLEELPSDAGVDGLEEHAEHIKTDAQVVKNMDSSKSAVQGQHTDADVKFDPAKNAESIQKEVSRELRLLAASLTDGPLQNQGLCALIDENARIEARMIDFAHVFPLEGTIEHRLRLLLVACCALSHLVACCALSHGSRDESYLCGLKNLMAVLEGIGEGLEPSKINVRWG